MNAFLKKNLKKFLTPKFGNVGSAIHRTDLKNALVVSVYHDVTETPSEFSRLFRLNVFPKIFERQIEFIKNNLNIISPDDLVSGSIPPYAAMISFDDGFQSYFRCALPILSRHKVPSIVFLNMEPVQRKNFWPGIVAYLFKYSRQFREHLEVMSKGKVSEDNLFPFSSKEMTDEYKNMVAACHEEIARFIGRFATENDLLTASREPNVFFGNHLFNHFVPAQLSDDEFVRSFSINQAELKKYPNSRLMFSFPFGQPGTSFSERHINLLSEQGVGKLFSSSGRINYNLGARCLDRVVLDSTHDSNEKIWGQIYFRTFVEKMSRSKYHGTE